MPLVDALLPEFDHEMAVTRKVLERVPDGQFDWKPHQKSMSLGQLAQHVATIPTWGKVAMSQDRGVTWTTRALGSTTNATNDGKTGAPSVSAYGSLIVVAWTADVDGKVIARVSTDAGATWSSATLATSAASYVTTGAASGRASVAWATATGLIVRTWRSSAWGPEVAVAPPASVRRGVEPRGQRGERVF